MDGILSRVTQHAVQYAIRSGISITTGYAIKSCSRLLTQAPKCKERDDLRVLQARLDGKIRVIAPSIDMIELIAARGNTSLESALSLTKEIRHEIQHMGVRLEQAVESETTLQAHTNKEDCHNLRLIVQEMQLLLARIEDAVPLISLAITTSGVNLSTKLAGTISPSRLLQASTFMTTADGRFTSTPDRRQQVGPVYTVRLYMLFKAHACRSGVEDGSRVPIWKEVIRKTRVKLWRIPLDQIYTLPNDPITAPAYATSKAVPADTKASEFAYQIVMIEDQDDGLYHELEDSTPFDDVAKAGIRDVVPVHEISKIFYADTGKILGIGNEGDTNPVLLLKRDIHAEPPRRMVQRTQAHADPRDELRHDQCRDLWEPTDDGVKIDAQLKHETSSPARIPDTSERHSPGSDLRIPADVDPEWMALEVYKDDQPLWESDNDSTDDFSHPSMDTSGPAENGLMSAFSSLHMQSNTSPAPISDNSSVYPQPQKLQLSPDKDSRQLIKTSLSLLEMLLKLAALQQFRQDSHLAIEDSATAGAGSDREYRQRLRHNATQRVGFDPYDESPIKRRGEEYIRNARRISPADSPLSSSALEYDNSLRHGIPIPKLDFARSSASTPDPPASARSSRCPLSQQSAPLRSYAGGEPTSDSHSSVQRQSCLSILDGN